MRFNVLLTAASVLSLAIAQPASAQASARQDTLTRATVTTAKNCTMSLRLLSLVLRDQATGSVLDSSLVSVTVSHKRTGRFLRNAEFVAFEPGQWVISEDAEVPFAPRSIEEVLVLEIRRRGGASSRHEVAIGYDTSGCHVEFRGALRERAELRVP